MSKNKTNGQNIGKVKNLNKNNKSQATLKDFRSKIRVAFIIFVILLVSLVGKVAYINATSGDQYSKSVLSNQAKTVTTIPNKRGMIMSSDGLILAYSEKVYNLIFDPNVLLAHEDCIEPTINALNKYFDLDKDKIRKIMEEKSTSHYQKLLKELTVDQISEFQNEMSENDYIKAVSFEETYIRKYPYGTTACDVVGFSSNANGGELGIELEYDEELTGVDGISYKYVDESLTVQSRNKDAVDGNNIISTIDYNLQTIVENKVKAYNEEYPSKNTAVIVMDPNTGEVLAMVSYPEFDLNNPRDLSGLYSEEELSNMTDDEIKDAMYSLWTNFCISESYEPGSVFKPITVAAGLEEGVVEDGETFNCEGSVNVADYMIKCHVYSTLGSHGEIDLRTGLINSCNPWMINIAMKLGNETFANYIQSFGFGSLTGIDLPGETEGIARDASAMTTIDAACNSFGQTINVNMIQMLSAYCSVINGGKYYKPHVVKRIETSTGEIVKEIEPTLVRETITQYTSDLLCSYLGSAVTDGLAAKAGVTGYSVAAKTGTAQKLPREDLKWLISVIGHAPAENPQLAFYVIIDEPAGTNGTQCDSIDNLTLAHAILEDLLPAANVYKDVNADEIDTSDAPVETAVEDLPEID